MVVEVGEEQDEGDGVSDEREVHPFGKVAVNVERVDGVDDGQAELQLQELGGGNRKNVNALDSDAAIYIV